MRPPRIFYGWWIVAAGIGINSLSSTLYVYGFGAFFIPWREAFGWSRATLGGLIGMARLEGGLMAPISGWLIDRFGPRRMMFLGLGVMGLGFLLLSRVNSLLMLYVVFIGFLAGGSSLGTGRAVQVAIANWFIRRRGRAMGLLFTGFGIGGSFVFLLGMVITRWGWQTGAIVAGLAIWLVGFPLAWLVRHRPSDMGLFPDGDPPPAATAAAPATLGEAIAAQSMSPSNADFVAPKPSKRRHFWMSDLRPEMDFTVRQALRTPAFWLMIITWFIWSAAPAINTVHLGPFLVEELGVDYAVAVAAISFFAFASTFGRLIFGFVADYVNIRLLVAVLLVVEGTGILLFSTVHTLAQVPLYVVIFAVAHGGITPMQSVLQGYFFGKKSFGTIGGVLGFSHLPASVGAPIWIGWLADTTPGGYRIAFRIVALALVVSAATILLARRSRLPAPAGQEKVLA